MHKSRNITLIISLIVLLVFSLAACSKEQSQPQKPNSSSMEQKPKSPPEAKKIVDDLDKIIAELDKTIKMKKQSPVQKNANLEPQGQAGEQSQEQGQSQGQEQTQGKQSQQSKGQSQQKSQGKSQQSGSQSPSSKQKSTGSQGMTQGATQEESSWKSLQQNLKSIHQSWNKLEPEAIKAGLSTTSRDNFEKTLEELTVKVGEKNPEDSVLAAATLYNDFSELARVFAMSIPPDFFQVKSEILAAAIEAERQQWDSAKEHLPAIQQHWNNLKLQAKNADAKLLNQTEFSVHDLEQAIKNENLDMVSIKAEIAMNNLKQLEKKLSSKTGSQGQ
ncbi:MAG: hypothetical protein ABFD08_18945 [Syntrophomonas sp.]